MKWIACGSFQNPKKAKQFVRFSSQEEFATQEEAEQLAQEWKEEGRYTFVWTEASVRVTA